MVALSYWCQVLQFLDQVLFVGEYQIQCVWLLFQKPSGPSLKLDSSTYLAYRNSCSLVSKYVVCELFMY